jgi:hypothetical protein
MLAVSDTPLIDAAVHAGRCAPWDGLVRNRSRRIAVAALRSAIPYDPPPEEIEAIARNRVLLRRENPDAMQSLSTGDFPLWRLEQGIVDDYRARPLWRELWGDSR